MTRPDDPSWPPPDWTGHWVCEQLGVQITSAADPRTGLRLPGLVGLALRRNPKRAHLLVSTVLGKHVPTDPRLVYGAGRLLGMLVAEALADSAAPVQTPPTELDLVRRGGDALTDALAGRPGAAAELLAIGRAHAEHWDARRGRPGAGEPALVLGYAETATGLGHAVADALKARYLHSTRRAVRGVPTQAGFSEDHSHASGHLLLPERGEVLTADGGAVVLVDDELSTGRTALNTIAALHAVRPRDRYVLAVLVDVRSPADRATLSARAAALGVRVDVVSLASGAIELPADVLVRGAALVQAHSEASGPLSARPPEPIAWASESQWPAGVREGARHGFDPSDRDALERAAAGGLA
ncbi:MAG: phosphoribosyl transferase family protein [Frankiales bacterium]|nr:phosphoribosyl transferase family protein [Frankiales bacterium]